MIGLLKQILVKKQAQIVPPYLNIISFNGLFFSMDSIL